MKDLTEIFDCGDEYNLVEATRKEKAKNPNLLGRLYFHWARLGQKNKNGRTYSEALIARECKRLNQELKESKVACSLEHPIEGKPYTRLDRCSHLLEFVGVDTEEKLAVAEAVVINSQAGRTLKILIQEGVKLGASSRGTGTLNSEGVVQDDYHLYGIDLVSSPSADLYVDRSQLQLFESVTEDVMCEEVIEPLYCLARKAGFSGGFDAFIQSLNERKFHDQMRKKINFSERRLAGFFFGRKK